MAVVLALLLVAGAVGSVAAAPAAQALPQTKQPSSARFTLTGQITSGSTTLTMTGDGAFSQNAMQMKLDMTGPSIGSTPLVIGVEYRLVNNVYYFKFGGLGGDPSLEKWYSMDLAALGGAMPGGTMPGGMMPGGMGGIGLIPGQMGADPSQIDPRLAEAFTITLVGPEQTITAVQATKYQIDVDVKKLMQLTGSDTAGLTYSDDFKMVMWMWIGNADLYVHQMALQMGGSVSSGDTVVPMSFDLTMTFTNFDEPVVVEVPANAEPFSLATLPTVPITAGVTTPLPPVPATPPVAVPATPPVSGAAPGMPRTGAGDGLLPAALVGLGLVVLTAGVALRRRAAVPVEIS